MGFNAGVACAFTTTIIAIIIIIIVLFPPFGYAVLGVVILAIIVAVYYYCHRRPRGKSDRSPISLLPTSVQQLEQAGVASDIPCAPNTTYTWDHGRGSIGLQPPPPAVMRGIDESPISSLLPTSAKQPEQAGAASDIPHAPNTDAPAYTWDHGRRESIVVQPPAVTRGIDRHESYSGVSITYSETSTLVPMYMMDGADR